MRNANRPEGRSSDLKIENENQEKAAKASVTIKVDGVSVTERRNQSPVVFDSEPRWSDFGLLSFTGLFAMEFFLTF